MNGVQPTVGNCRAGTYTLVRPFIFASDGPLSPDAKAFVDYVLGDFGQTILKGEGLIPPR